MPVEGVNGYLDVESAALRVPQVGVANTNPQHILSVGSNLFVSGDSSDVLTVTGNVVAEGLKLGFIEIYPSFDLEAITTVGNVTSNTLQFNNATTGFVTTANIEVGTANLFVDTQMSRIGVGTRTPGATLHVAGDTIITGNLNILGTTTTIDTENLRVKDPIIELGKDNVGTGDLGFVMTRPTGNSNVAVIFDEDTDTLEIGYTQGNASQSTITVQTAVDLKVNVNGTLTVSSNLEVGTANLFVDTTTGNVGIGKTNPGSALDVVGNVFVSSNLEVGTANLFVDTLTGNVGIGKTNPGSALDVVGNVFVSSNLEVGTANLFVDTLTGNVGIGKTNPGSALDVVGNVFVSSNLEVGTANLFVDTTTGNVGIGKTNPGSALDVVGDVAISSNLAVDTNTLFVDSVGNKVGIGTDSPTSNLHVVGDALITGNVADLNVVSNVNMLHTSNTASIKLNSNVVVEFPRSKKLIKYPRVALTGYSQDGYVVSSTTNYYDAGNPLYPWQVFNGIGYRYQSIRTDYSSSTGNYTGTVNQTTVDGSLIGGEWVQLQLPNKISLNRFTVALNMPSHGGRMGRSYVLAGSNDGSTWTTVSTHTQSYGNGGDGKDVNHDVNSTTMYKYYRLIATATFHNTQANGGAWALGKWKLFGTPEYDPEAHGVDVVVKSVPNVPNTDWLEVYYDAKDLVDGAVSSVNDLKPSSLGSAINSISVTNVTVSDKAFVFNGTSDIRSTVSTFTGDQPHTMSVWVNISILHTLGDGYICILAPSAGETTDKVSSIRYQNDGFNLQSWDNDIQMYNLGIQKNRWYHLVVVYDGGGVTTSSKRLYIDTLQNLQISTDNTTSNSINFTNTTLSLGSRVSGTSSHLTGSIANFRLFNRALTSDEIYQLYAYQKEDFGHGVLGMTLKNGRLGIGTSEPRAALDVRGDIVGPFHTFLTGDVTTSSSTSFTASNQVKALNSFTFDVPKEYNSYGTANLEVFGQVKWSGEVEVPWNTVLKLRLYYGNLTTQIIHSVENPEAGTNNRGCGMIAISNHSDNGSTLDSAIASSKFLIPNCPVGPGSQLKLEILIQQGNSTSTVYTNRTTGALDDPNYERGTTNFFMALKVV